MEITLITTSPFRGLEQIEEITVPSLMSQTCKDFVWLYLDGFYHENKQYFSDLKKKLPFPVVHVPLLHDWTRPHQYHWEPYNSAVLLCETKYFLRFGRFRFFHPKTVEDVLSFLRKEKCVVTLNQKQFHELEFFDNGGIKKNNEQITANYVAKWHQEGADKFIDTLNLRQKLEWKVSGLTCGSGMFASSKSLFIEELNGNDEVGLHFHHFEDVEMSTRLRFLTNTKCFATSYGLARFGHNKSTDKNNYFKDMYNTSKQPCEDASNCLLVAHKKIAADVETSLREQQLDKYVQKLTLDGIDFYMCPGCDAVIPLKVHRHYTECVYKRNLPKSLIGLDNRVGRNLSIVSNDLSSLKTLDSRVQLLHNSYKERKYFNK